MLKGLDAAVARTDPASERIYLALRPPESRRGVPTPNGEALLKEPAKP